MLQRAPARAPPRRVKRQPPASWGSPIEVKNLEFWRYQWHEEILKRWDLCRSEIAVAGVLMHEYRTDRGYAEIGLERLAAKAGCTRSIAFKATKRLRQKGLIAARNAGQRRPDASLATHRYGLIYASRGVN